MLFYHLNVTWEVLPGRQMVPYLTAGVGSAIMISVRLHPTRLLPSVSEEAICRRACSVLERMRPTPPQLR